MKLAGYTFLIDELSLALPPIGLELAVGDKNEEEIRPYGSTRIKLLKKSQRVGETPCEHLETAIKYQGIRLAYLVPIFEKLVEADITAHILQKPQATINRCIWYLYEWLTDSVLEIENSQSNYAPLLDDRYYFALENGVRNPRTRIVNNMLGNKSFCPMIRKTPLVKANQHKDLMEMAQAELTQVHGFVNPELLGRSIEYLYTKETKSSTEIEREDTSNDKMRRFYRVLKTSGNISLSKRRLLDIQHEIVRSEMKEEDYRDEEIYVGETRPTWLDGFEEDIHFIGPRHQDVGDMMNGWLETHRALLLDDTIPPMMHAAIMSFGFVYIHPFSDGNGRIHRYLIHDVLKSRIKTEKDFIIPVSATILQRPEEYDRALETISKAVMALIDYDIDESDHSITINNDISYLYRYLDLTPHVEYLYKTMETSISQDLVQEVIYIVKYDAVKKAIEDVLDIPNKELNLFIQLAIQGNGTISKSKRPRFDRWMSGEQLLALERTIGKILDQINRDAIEE